MDTLNIYDKLGWVNFDDVRPSAFQKFLKEINEWLPGYGITLKQLLEQKESDVRAHTTISDRDFEHIKKEFGAFGLHFGMTEQEFADYQDVEYLKKHPEEAYSLTFDYLPDGVTIDKKVLEQRVQDKLNEEGVNYLKLPTWSAKETRSFYQEQFNKNMLLSKIDCDYEWMEFRAMYVAYQKQPWFYRLLYSTEKRLEIAKEESHKFMVTFTESMFDRLVNNAHEKFLMDSKRIREKNNENSEMRKTIRQEVETQYRNELIEAQKAKTKAEIEAKVEQVKSRSSIDEMPF